MYDEIDEIRYVAEQITQSLPWIVTEESSFRV